MFLANFRRSTMLMQQLNARKVATWNMYRQFAIVTRYTKSHEWVKLDTDTKLATIGITDYAQKQLGDIVHVDLPEVGANFEVSDIMVSVESTKTAGDVYAMCQGSVHAVNDKIQSDCEIIN